MTASRILIIEDDPALLRGLKDNFAAAGYDVRTAADGQRGLDALLAEPPDLVLLDLMLPRVSGYDIPFPPAKLESVYLPDADRVLEAVDRVLAY